jgi:choline dehydrogenase
MRRLAECCWCRSSVLNIRGIVKTYDYVIVGGGTAGCVLANRLSADPANRVLVLEAGGRDWNPMIHAPGGMLPIMLSGAYSWHYRTAPQRHLADRVFTMPRGKVLGGSSSTNGMVYSRGTPRDYDRWRDLGNPGWSYDEVLPYFKRAETHPLGESEFHGRSGPVRISRAGIRHPFAKAFVAAGQEAGYPFNEDTDGARREGFGPLDMLACRGRRSSTAVAYLRAALRRPNLKVVTGARTTRILIEGTRATAVEYLKSGRAVRVAADREVILAAGALHSPQLLMLSGVGAAAQLQRHGIDVRHDLPGVGRGLQDHVSISVQCSATQPISMLQYLSPVKGALAFARYVLMRRGPLADPGFEAIAFVKSRPELSDPDLKLQFVMALYRHNGRELIPMHGFFSHISLTTTESFGSVGLRSSDPLDLPLVDQNYLDCERDRQSMRAGVRIARRVFAQDAFAPYRGEELMPGSKVTTDVEIDEFIRQKAEPDFHSVGTCRMGQDGDAVVDPQLRVRGLTGLRVVDASVMPRLVGGGTCMPTVMIAEKGSDLILGQGA